MIKSSVVRKQAMYQAKKNGKNGYRIYDSLKMNSGKGEMGS